jgi:phosphoribosyl 1,2-cyclic phosphodiesterase
MMKINLWGVRGSIPTPVSSGAIRGKIKKALSMAKPGDLSSEESVDSFIDGLPFAVRGTYGGNTTCIELRSSSGDLVIIDCGSGMKNLGMSLMKEEFSQGKGTGSIFMTHTHWDHVQGIPFFVPFYIKGNRFNFYSPIKDLRARLEYQQVPTHFPVDLDYMQARKECFVFGDNEELYLNDIKVIAKCMPHPGSAYGLRFEENGKSFVYSSDCEFNINVLDEIDDYLKLFTNADVVVFDTQYTFQESFEKFDYGHSSASIAIDIASKFKVKRLILFHHEPEYSDEKLDNMLSNARTYLYMNKKKQQGLQVDIAYEGMVIEV